MHCCTATSSEPAALCSCCTQKVHHIPSVSESTHITADQDIFFFSWTFLENVGFKMIVHAFKISSRLPSLLHLPCPIPPAVTHICQCTCTAVLEPFLSARLNGLTGLRTKDFPILLKESTSQQKQFLFFLTIHPSAYRRHPREPPVHWELFWQVYSYISESFHALLEGWRF